MISHIVHRTSNELKQEIYIYNIFEHGRRDIWTFRELSRVVHSYMFGMWFLAARICMQYVQSVSERDANTTIDLFFK